MVKKMVINMKAGEAGRRFRNTLGRLANIPRGFKWVEKAVIRGKNGTKKEEESIDSIEGFELREGEFRVLMSGVNADQINEFEQSLYLIKGIRLLLIIGSAEEGTQFIVSTDKQVNLSGALREMGYVEFVSENDNTIHVIPKTPCIIAS